MSDITSPTTRGRPRNPDRTTDILDATVALLREVSWSRLRMQDVADRAGTGLSTIYRRWPTKEHLIADTIRYEAFFDYPISDDPEAGLHDLVATSTDHLGAVKNSFIAMVADTMDHPEIAAAIDEVVQVRARHVLAQALSRVIGDDHPLTATLVDTIISLVISRATGFGSSSGDHVADEALALVNAVRSAPATGRS